jgi:hypothetical protein
MYSKTVFLARSSHGLILNILDLSQNEIQFKDFNAFEGILYFDKFSYFFLKF